MIPTALVTGSKQSRVYHVGIPMADSWECQGDGAAFGLPAPLN